MSRRSRADWSLVVWSALTLSLTALTAAKGWSGSWTGDFWSHSAAVHELLQRWPAPRHPEIAADLPGCFFTPYTLAVAMVARAGDLSAVTALGLAGAINVVLLMAGLRAWVGVVVPETPRNRVVLFASVLILLFWGTQPWIWSGFFHLESLPLVAPYPSTFAAALMFAALAAYGGWMQGGRLRLLIAAVAIAAVLPLTHAPTTVVFGVGLAAHSLATAARPYWQRVAALAAMGAAGLLLAASWPLYPFFELLFESADYHETNAAMYDHVLAQAWPALLGVPIMLMRVWRKRADTLGLFFLGLTACYLYGWLTGELAFGRVLSYQIVGLQIAIAGWVARLAAAGAAQSRERVLATAGLATVSIALVIAVSINQRGLATIVTQHPDWTSTYRFLPEHVGQDDVVLADSVTGYPVPSFAGKVIAHVGNLDLVPDAVERLQAVDAFFSEDFTDEERQRVIERYRVRWLLLAREHPLTPHLLNTIAGAGHVVHDSGGLTLIDLTAEAAEPAPNQAL